MGENSLNHIMFGDIDAWMYQYLGGISPDPENPGFRHILVKPNPVGSLTWAKAEHRIASGLISSFWKRLPDSFELSLEVPKGSEATVTLPDGSVRKVEAGEHRLKCPL